MADSIYLDGRNNYIRPKAVLFSNNAPTVDGNGFYVVSGTEVGSAANDAGDFLLLSDHNRAPLQVNMQRIENRQRMVNGRMRSYWVADKRTISISWDNLPSRAFSSDPNFNTSTGIPANLAANPNIYSADTLAQYTVDGGAGGVELLDWYENHYGTFWVLLAYDKYSEFNVGNVSGTKNAASFTKLGQYNEKLEMYITDFQYSVQKRGASTTDLWNVTITLEEA